MTLEQAVVARRRAEEALAARLHSWGVANPEAKAAEFMAALCAQGWRHQPALTRPAADDGRAVGPTDEWRTARTRLNARERVTA